jgi:chromosome segregation ATPase
MIADGVEKMPEYVEAARDNVEKAYGRLSEYKAELRKKANEIIITRQGMGEVISQIQSDYQSLERKYAELERERKESLEDGKPLSEAKLAQIDTLENMLGEYRDALSRAELEADEAHNVLSAINQQIEKFGEYQDMLGKALKVIRRGEGYIKLQVPYVKEEIYSQRALGTALVAVTRSIDLLDQQSKTATRYNALIADAIVAIHNQVDEFVTTTMSASILPDGAKVPELPDSKAEAAGELPESEEATVENRQYLPAPKGKDAKTVA